MSPSTTRAPGCTLSADAVREILDGTGATDNARHELEARFHSCAAQLLEADAGYVVIAGLEDLAEPEARRFVIEVSSLLGEPIAQTFGGELVREVADRGQRLEEDANLRYSETRHGGNLHTDGCHRDPVPDLFTLFCVRCAASGGALVLVRVADLLRELNGQPDVLETLTQPVHFDTRDTRTPGAPRSVARPVIDETDERPRIHYMRAYIDSAQAQPGVPRLSPDQVHALDVLDGLLGRRDLQVHLHLQPGHMAVVDNRAVVHGRTTFANGPGSAGRLLLRTWIRTRTGRPADAAIVPHHRDGAS